MAATKHSSTWACQADAPCQNKSHFTLEYLFLWFINLNNVTFQEAQRCLPQSHPFYLLCLPWLPDSKFTKALWSISNPFQLQIYISIAFSSETLHWCPWKRGQQSFSDIFGRCTPLICRYTRCGHTYLLPIAVCSEGPVSSPPQCRSVVIEVTSGVHLVLDIQKTTDWLESSLSPLKTALPLVVAKLEQSQAYMFKNTHRSRWTTSKQHWHQLENCCLCISPSSPSHSSLPFRFWISFCM